MAEAPPLKIDAIEVLQALADNNTDLTTAAALREATTALRRLKAIKAEHHKHEKTTDAGTLVWPSIHGFKLHSLLYGAIDEAF